MEPLRSAEFEKQICKGKTFGQEFLQDDGTGVGQGFPAEVATFALGSTAVFSQIEVAAVIQIHVENQRPLVRCRTTDVDGDGKLFDCRSLQLRGAANALLGPGTIGQSEAEVPTLLGCTRAKTILFLYCSSRFCLSGCTKGKIPCKAGCTRDARKRSSQNPCDSFSAPV